MRTETFDKSTHIYCVLSVFFAVTLIVTNLVVSKFIPHPFFSKTVVSASDLIYPLTFLLSNVIAEVWGPGKAKFVVKVGLLVFCYH